MALGGSIVCPQPVCYRCLHRRDWAAKPIYAPEGYVEGHQEFCDFYPDGDGVPSKCMDIKDFLAQEDYIKVCEHFERGPGQWVQPSKT